MSIVTLKKKSNTKYNTISGRGTQGFSLNGGYRNTHYIGQTSLSRPTIRTIFKGNTPVGNGGCCGTYKIDIIAPQCCVNDNTIIKTSTKNTKGYILSEFIYPTCNNETNNNACSNHTIWVKDTNPLSHTQSKHIQKVKQTCLTCNNHIVSTSSNENCQVCNTNTDTGESTNNEKYFIGTRAFTKSHHWKNYKDGALDSSQYTDGILLRKKCLPTPDCKATFPMLLHKGGCNVEAKTPEEAIEKGLLPSNWLQC